MSIPVFLVPLIFLFIGFYEYCQFGIIQDQALIRGYHFGSEAMIAYGGEKYQSAESYAQSILYLVLINMTAFLVTIVIFVKAKNRVLLKSYFVILLTVGCSYLVL